MTSEPFAPAPGRGAARRHMPTAAATHFVYVVESRRTGELSIGVDLTPGGECPWSCDYCQVPGEHEKKPPEPVDLDLLRAELRDALASAGDRVCDIAFAGAGEPTWSPSFPEALVVAEHVASERTPRPKVRVFTCGSSLDKPSVHQALVELVEKGRGEVWIKVDGWDEETFARFDGVRGQAAHEARLTRFSHRVPIVVQTLVAHREGGPDLHTTAAGLGAVVKRLVDGGARIERVILTTILRPPGNPASGGRGGPVRLRAYDEAELARVAVEIRASGVRVDRVALRPQDTP